VIAELLALYATQDIGVKRADVTLCELGFQQRRETRETLPRLGENRNDMEALGVLGAEKTKATEAAIKTVAGAPAK